MFFSDSDINEQIDIHQRRSRLQDPKDPDTQAVSNIFIYGSFYYPHSKQFLGKVVKILKEKHVGVISDAISHLYSCIEREVIFGPSSSFNPPSELPYLYHDDALLKLEPQSHEEQHALLAKSIERLGLDGLFQKEDIPELAWYNCELFLSQANVQQSK